ncbi:S-layer homology domain-containing protein [Veillonella sp. DNF00869]|uniref:S-layer homology domain-containing protein n=1 Tax=Veillonella sp. DNF00869 TaxID=1384081 RepID=UPI0007853252|nr:S-layer homology domain-containing protein [Veillonella sp. DNF00869]KXB88018.1 hypothetical protein HMPREF3032_00820 [Veillonella sp. DNF00869]
MKKHLAVLAATAVLGVTSAFAANPFSDVTPQDWAYQAVAQLAAQGVVNGYPDGTFKGQHNITRYEMAQMVAKALVRQDRVDAEQNAIINRLANEFSAELNNLGVRVATLENKVGNFAFTGDARLRYQGSHTKENLYVNDEDTESPRLSKFDYRARVQFEATVNDNTKAVVRLSTEKEFGANDKDNTTAASVDQVYVQHNFGKYATATVGRQDLVIGSGLTYDGAFEGAQATVGKDKLNATVSYGYMVDGDLADRSREENAQTTSYQVNAKLGKHVDAKGYYVQYHGDKSENYFGGAVDTHFGPHSKVWLGGEYSRYEALGAAGEGWTAGIGYGKYDITKPGTWSTKAQYFRLGEVAPVTSPTWNLPDISNSNFRGWLGTIDYAVAKNVGVTLNAQLRSKNLDGYALPDYYRAELNYQF